MSRPGRALRLLVRALLLRCPRCGGGPLFRSWFKLRERCASCGLRLEREEGYFTGAMTINLVTTELVWAAAFVGVLVTSWPDPPWTILQWGSIGLMLLFPLLFFRHSRTLWLAFDLHFRSVEQYGGADQPVSGQ